MREIRGGGIELEKGEGRVDEEKKGGDDNSRHKLFAPFAICNHVEKNPGKFFCKRSGKFSKTNTKFLVSHRF